MQSCNFPGHFVLLFASKDGVNVYPLYVYPWLNKKSKKNDFLMDLVVNCNGGCKIISPLGLKRKVGFIQRM